MVNSRSKGQRGEREVADLLNATILEATGKPGDFHRNWQEQSHHGGCDLISETYPQLAIEVKLYQKFTPAMVDGWWQQAARQARIGQHPVLFYRKIRQPWRVRLILDASPFSIGSQDSFPFVADISATAFLEFFEVWLEGV